MTATKVTHTLTLRCDMVDLTFYFPSGALCDAAYKLVNDAVEAWHTLDKVAVQRVEVIDIYGKAVIPVHEINFVRMRRYEWEAT